jgi:type I restriction enzyme, S subunit
MRTGPFGSDLRHSEFVDKGVAVLGIDNAVNNTFEWAERRYITEEKYKQLRRYRVQPSDVIVTIMGTTGRSAVVPENIPEAITTKHLATITPDRNQILPEVLSFAIHSDPMVIRQIKRANKGAIMSGLNLGIIKSLELRRAPLRFQEKFVSISKRMGVLRSRLSDPQISGEALFASLSQRAFRGEL